MAKSFICLLLASRES